MTIIAQRGAVMYVCRNAYYNFMAIRYEGSAVIVTSELIRREYIADDIVEFDAGVISKADANFYNTVKPKWKASRVKFIKHAQTFTGTGKIINIDPKGEYCFVESQLNGTTLNVFCTRISIQPYINDINSMFSSGNTVKFFAKEQVATQKNNNVKWRTVVATDTKHELKPKLHGSIHTYEAVPITQAPPAPKPAAPKLRTASSGAIRPPTAADAVRQGIPAPPPAKPIAPPKRRETPAPTDKSVSFNEDQLQADVMNAIGMRSDGTQLPPQQQHGDVSLEPPPGLEAPAPCNHTSHPMPSYEWMKFDLIKTLESYPDPKGNKLQEESQKLRAIAHHLTDNICSFCLSR